MMTIRRKVLLLFGVIAIVPALITAILDTALLRSLSGEITARNSAASTEQTVTLMRRIADEYARSLDYESRRIRVLVNLQRERAERLLHTDDTLVNDRRPLFAEEFDNANTAPEMQSLSIGNRSARVSWEHQVYFAPRTVDRESVIESAKSLLEMRSLYRKIRGFNDHVIRSHYVVLDNGLSAAFPGHGGYPEDFDARARPWFEAQRDDPGFRWFQPHIDAASEALVINATAPIFDRENQFIGITGIDIDLEATFQILELPPHLAEGSELMQVVAVEPPATPEPSILILARQNHALQNAGWETLPQLKRFFLTDAADNKTMRNAMLAGDNGHLVTQLHDQESIVLFRRFGETLSYIVMIVPMARATDAAMAADDFAKGATRQHVRTLITMLLIIGILVIAIAVLGARQLTQPIEQLKFAVEQLGGGDFSTRANIRTGDELELLGRAFDTMVPRLEAHAKVEESLALAREIQQQLLPAEPPQLAGFEIHGVSLYSDETGGDYFDFVPLYTEHGRRIGVVVADVSGHGIGPALLMATTRALLHGSRGRGLSLGQALEFVNAQLAEDVSRGHFVTLFLVALDENQSAIEWTTAGHDPALHFRADETRFSELGGDGIPLGIDASWNYGVRDDAELRPGDIVVIGTDGIWETTNPDGERFGKERLRDLVHDRRECSAGEICEAIKRALDDFRGDVSQHDDVTIVVIKRV